MPQSTPPNEEVIATFLPQILDNEARGILSDLSVQPILALEFMDFTLDDTHQAIKHVVGIFEECFHAGHLKVVVSYVGETLYGYALAFILPIKGMAAYCHKIFVYEQYRGRGIGQQILSNVLESFPAVCLICAPELSSFYTNAGFKNKGELSLPRDQSGFTLSSGLYKGLVVMSTSDMTGQEPMFLLNDSDVSALIAIRRRNASCSTKL
ncbi:GNAT family N-acetyltransferase [Pseudomonas syringae]|uniref:GNAT family N-acetyltransferase n=1 Tax=Pseudomonas syringae TaxID=317 RepID=UPI001F10A29F|nr:GNAT family N-acetyltransferase [Pseudomonas syringae]MCH5490483.1 GNAT family N-acetyltransferase [Pseudomonas syringae pv. syringae]MDO1461016.1 GNAT family N-acetyltransferase [Pseudomonas syringae pv. syringae]